MTEEDTCKFGHIFKGGGSDLTDSIEKKGELKDLEDVKEATGTYFLGGILDDPIRTLKVSAGSSGTPYGIILGASDHIDTNMGYTVAKSEERLFVSPQNQLHQSFVQRKSEAESNVRETMRNISQLRKQKHMLEHDIRKLRSRAEAVEDQDEAQLKADFVELVDGAGGGAQQGAEEMPLKSFRDNNIYPTIVADFNEMRSEEDLKPPEKSEFDSPHLHDLPKNEKAILKKKWMMYERWKDLYGSEVQRKLNELKGQLRSIERSIEETKEWLQPYVQDLTMIHDKEKAHFDDDFTKHYTIEGYASMDRNIEYIAYQPMKKKGDSIEVIDDEDDATHYRIIYMHAVHVNLAGGEQPQDPSQGPATAILKLHPVFVCKHVFESIFKKKINRQADRFNDLLEDYTGEFHTEEGDELKEARTNEGISVRELREKISEELGEDVPVKVSSQIRRIEDGIDRPDELGEEYLEAVDEILGTSFMEEEDSESDQYDSFEKTVKKFVGLTDEYYVPSSANPFFETTMQVKYGFYVDFKISQGLVTMK